MRQRIVLIVLAMALVAAACGSDTSVFDLGVGDCFNDQDDLTQTEVSSVATVDCSEPHDNEIFFEFSMTESFYPGDEAAVDSAGFRCLDEFSAFVGIEYADSDLGLFPITPTRRSWDEGDRVVYCALYAVDLSQLRGSMRGSRR